jgi:hypothetical protein
MTLRRVPEAVGILAGRLAAGLELAAALLGAVALQPSAVLPLLRAAAQLLTVDSLATLQVKCIGARSHAPPRHYGILRETLPSILLTCCMNVRRTVSTSW